MRVHVCVHNSIVYVCIIYMMTIQDNNYVAAIKSVATILSDYDSDQQFPSFGFGAKAHQFKDVSHCFPLNFNFSAPEVTGVQVPMHASLSIKAI